MGLNPAFKFGVLSIPASILFIVPTYSDPINLPKILSLVPFALVSVVLLATLPSIYKKMTLGNNLKIALSLYISLAITMTVSGFLGSENYIRVLFGTTGRNNGLIYYLTAIAIAIVILLSKIGLKEIEYLHKTILGTSIFFSLYSLLQLLGLDPIKWNNPYNRIIGTLGNPNFSASALGCFSVYWMYLFLRTTPRMRISNIAVLSASLGIAYLAWATESLQGSVVTIVGVLLLGYVHFRQKFGSKLFQLSFLSLGGTGLVFIFSSFLGLGPLGDVLEQYTLRLRGLYAFIGFKAMLESPWTGVGVDNYIVAFRRFRTQEFISQYGAALSNNNAHSTPAQIGATFGLIVFLIYIAIHLLVAFKAFSVLNSKDENNYWLKGIAIVWLLVFAQSLLSIEIIGLGILNWVLGAVIISMTLGSRELGVQKLSSESKKIIPTEFPAWVGSLTIVTLLVGFVPLAIVSREDSAYSNIARVQVSDEQSVLWIKENFKKLTTFTLLSPDKVDRILGNLYKANMSEEIKEISENIYRVNKSDAFAGDILATYYQNTQQLQNEIELREELRDLDPWNYWLELALANAYSSNGDLGSLRNSVSRIHKIAPESLEYRNALDLLKNLEAKKS